MREVADVPRIRAFMRALGRKADADARLYFTGGATAVLIGWRASTIDVYRYPAVDAASFRRAVDDFLSNV